MRTRKKYRPRGRHRCYARGIADKHSLYYEEPEGQTELIEKLIHGPWDESTDGECVLIQPGETVKLENFMTGST